MYSSLSSGLTNGSVMMPVTTADNGSSLIVMVQFKGGNHTFSLNSSSTAFDYYITFHCMYTYTRNGINLFSVAY